MDCVRGASSMPLTSNGSGSDVPFGERQKTGPESCEESGPGYCFTNWEERSLLVEDDRSEFAEAAAPGQPLVGGSLGHEERGLDAEFVEGIRDALGVLGTLLGAEADEDVVDVL